ncbi:MAG: hypothetical protein V1875_04290 [Candidatus Altiarchaeota archaeon]
MAEDDLKLLQADEAAVERTLGISFADTKGVRMLMVVGGNLSDLEEAVVLYSTHREVRFDLTVMGENDASLDELVNTTDYVFLAGGPLQNKITNDLYASGLVYGKDRRQPSRLSFFLEKTNTTAKFLVLSDNGGYPKDTAVLYRRAVDYSPLSWIMPREYVPIAASAAGAASISLLGLLKSVLAAPLRFLKEWLEAVCANWGKGGKNIRPGAWSIYGIKIREVASVAAAAFVCSVALTWTYSGPTFDFPPLLILNIVICVVFGFSHMLLNWSINRIMGFQVEYRLWVSGSLTTLVTGLLGNAFGAQGFLIEEVKELKKRKKLVSMLIPVVYSTVLMVSFAALNWAFPSTVSKMICSATAISVLADMLPVKPMKGYNLAKLSIPIWLMTFVLVGGAYTTVSFLV